MTLYEVIVMTLYCTCMLVLASSRLMSLISWRSWSSYSVMEHVRETSQDTTGLTSWEHPVRNVPHNSRNIVV